MLKFDEASRAVIAWNPRSPDSLLRGRQAPRREVWVHGESVRHFAAPSWIVLETGPGIVEIEADCSWAAAWRGV